jgi:hypothetical protein
MNFNDIISAMVTLFSLSVVNNWYIICNMCCLIKGSNYYRLYFYAFYFFGVLVGLNIIVAFAIDMYSAVNRL